MQRRSRSRRRLAACNCCAEAGHIVVANAPFKCTIPQNKTWNQRLQVPQGGAGVAPRQESRRPQRAGDVCTHQPGLRDAVRPFVHAAASAPLTRTARARREYDQYGSEGTARRASGPVPDMFMHRDPFELFRDLFGGNPFDSAQAAAHCCTPSHAQLASPRSRPRPCSAAATPSQAAPHVLPCRAHRRADMGFPSMHSPFGGPSLLGAFPASGCGRPC